MTHRYFVESPVAPPLAVLVGPEAHHLLHVMRARPGTEVVLFDGSGDEFPARVEKLRRSEVELVVLDRRTVDRELPFPLVLGVALPKGDRQRWLVEKAVELGVSRLVPLDTARSIAQPDAKAVDRLRRAVIEASKQCGRNRLMEITLAHSWARFAASHPDAPLRLLAHPSAGSPWPANPAPEAGPVVAAVGPEGGFTDDELLDATGQGWQP
ncbi:MAG: RsmE family RNA methyltransferase, partial [Thermoguttaceae bacterium]